MYADVFLHKLLGSTISKALIDMIYPMVSGIIKTKQLQLRSLGRNLDLPIQERSGIRKVDRFLVSPKVIKGIPLIYGAITRYLIGTKTRPILIVDWSKLPNVNEYILRVALAAEGRALTIYEEKHPKAKENNAQIHDAFLVHLSTLLPAQCCPIIVTDAGFKNPLFKSVKRLGWDYVGRVKNRTHCSGNQKSFAPCFLLHSQARVIPKDLGEKILAKKNPLTTNFYIYTHKLKGRIKKNKDGKQSTDKDSKNHSKSYREPWLLVSSIKGPHNFAAKKVVNIYTIRMTIEEGFRDLKSNKYGLSLEDNETKKTARLIVWLMLAALTCLYAWIIGFAAEAINLQRQFQANSIRHRRVLSFFYLGCQIIRKKIEIIIDLNSIIFFDESKII